MGKPTLSAPDSAKKNVRRVTSRLTSRFLVGSKSLVSSLTKRSFATVATEGASDDDKLDGDAGSVTNRRSTAETLSSTQAAQAVAGDYFSEREGPGPSGAGLSAAQAAQLVAADYFGEGEGASGGLATNDRAGLGAASTGTLSLAEDALALEVGLNAQEYLDECFYAEVAVLDRAKFDAIPEMTKADFTIKGHLGKGSFCDVFDVVCRSDKTAPMETTGGSALRPISRRRSTARLTLTSSMNSATTARPRVEGEARQNLAMKCLRPEVRANEEQFAIGAEDLVHETAILANLDHSNIIKLHGRALGKLTDAFMLNDGYFILLEKLSETLNDRIDEWKRTKSTLRKVKQMKVAHQIASAMAYLHSRHVVFRDLKPANVGFDQMGCVKLFDFGFAVALPRKDPSNPSGLLYDRCGTTRYMAPEIAKELGYGIKADVYSFGILLWEMCSQEKPFSHIKSPEEFYLVVFEGGHRPEIGKCWPATVKRLLRSCWAQAPRDRPAMADVKSSLSVSMAVGSSAYK